MGIRLKDITAGAVGLVNSANSFLTNTSGDLTRLFSWSTFADWVIQTYAGFSQSGTGAISGTVEGQFRKFTFLSDWTTEAQFNTARDALTGRMATPPLEIVKTTVGADGEPRLLLGPWTTVYGSGEDKGIVIDETAGLRSAAIDFIPGNADRNAILRFWPEQNASVEDVTMQVHKMSGAATHRHFQIHTKNAAGTTVVDRFYIEYLTDDAAIQISSAHLQFDSSTGYISGDVRFGNGTSELTNPLISFYGGTGVAGEGRPGSIQMNSSRVFTFGAWDGMSFYTNVGAGSAPSTGTLGLHQSSAGNVGIGVTSFGTNAVKVLSIGTGTAPTTGPTDTVQFYSSDLSAGNTIPSFFCEGSGVFASGTPAASTGSIAMRINGTVYHFTVSDTAAS